MNAKELIAEAKEIVDDDGYTDADFLKRLNHAQNKLAQRLFLPDLKSGYDTVTTAIGANSVNMPSSYHKGLYLAGSGGVDLDIYETLIDIHTIKGPLTLDAGDLSSVVVHGTILMYQGVPSTETTIQLFYYRNPDDMTDSNLSFPDGAKGNEDFEWAMIHDTAAHFFSLIEDGYAGQKANTLEHEELFTQRATALDMYATIDGKNFVKRPPTNLGWLGAR